ncbi:hypothetical protein MW887_002590 [Aspergillus wentii]|nr:hypothetical protein MW887_002590 [Aspergillus wentii]
MQDLPQSRHRAQQGREPSVLRHLQLVRFSSFRRCHQDWFPWTGRSPKETGLNGGTRWCPWGCVAVVVVPTLSVVLSFSYLV